MEARPNRRSAKPRITTMVINKRSARSTSRRTAGGSISLISKFQQPKRGLQESRTKQVCGLNVQLRSEAYEGGGHEVVICCLNNRLSLRFDLSILMSNNDLY
ncbi:hypothetical protein GQ600_5085 [Phytophthora cactorum]|nr:hypothetical protein GQ600_5085 [Phytophthora cactorum]